MEIRFGIIGFGMQGQTYASILSGKPFWGNCVVAKPENCILAAVSNISGPNTSFVKLESNVKFYQDWKEMINDKVCDAVVLTVPHFLHVEIAVYAMEHGVHVLCEKPAAVQASEVEKMLMISNKYPNIALGLMLNQRANDIFTKIKSIIDSGELGTIRRSNWIINNQWRNDFYYQNNSWRGTWNGEGGGILVNQLPHQLDLWTWLCGVPINVSAICRMGAYRDITVENDITVFVEYESGATGCLTSCTHDPIGTDRLEINLSRGKIIVENSRKATIQTFQKDEADWNDTTEFRSFSDNIKRNPDKMYKITEITSKFVPGVDYTIIFKNFAEHILNGIALIAPGESGLIPVQLANTILLASFEKKQIPFPCENSSFDELLTKLKNEEKKLQLKSVKVPITNIGHASFMACNLKEMTHFYCDILGMKQLFSSTFQELYSTLKNRFGDSPSEEKKKHLLNLKLKGEEEWVKYLKLADRQYLELFSDGGQKRDKYPDRNDYYGYKKLNFEVLDIEKIKNRLVENEVRIDGDINKSVDGSLEIMVHDPDGNEVQFTQYSDIAREKLGMLPISLDDDNEFSQLRYTTQVAYQVRANTKMKRFYSEGLGLKNVRTITYSELLKSIEQKGVMKNEEMLRKLKSLGNLPWLDFIEVVPHQYIELFYDYTGEKKEQRDLTNNYGYQHLCLEVDNINEAWKSVIANGLTPDTPINLGVDKSLQFWLVDPDGNRIELMQYTSDSKQMLL